MLLNPKALEAWFTLMAEAMKGSNEAQNAFQTLSELSGNSEDTQRWMSEFMPKAMSSNFQPEQFESLLEDWWRTMGVVPRARYLELLEKCDTLQRRLDKAEETNQKLRDMLGTHGKQEADTQQALDMWGTMMSETLKTQAEWMRNWAEANKKSSDSESESEEPTTQEKSEDTD